MNIFDRIGLGFVQRRLANMLQGYKVYILCLVGVLYTLVGWLFGPVDVGGLHIPSYDVNGMYKQVYELLILAGFRSGVKKIGNSK